MKRIIDFELAHISSLVEMALDLWKGSTYDDLKSMYEKIYFSHKEHVLLYECEADFLAFIQVSIRNDYVEGSHSSPVGYVEGIYVKQSHRGNKIAKELVAAGERWAATKGCNQMGSDIELHNDISYEFHKKIGFQEANRIICFIKDIK
ncbi:aminoglycoside 6'-N-acetyltransferase [Evansella cellulosilytica]|uniref:Aminoglycoside N(6')-acetyltransferase type 1 n=1 Tax=Evansella cellulosilytica (strain ATCC 21833 / DSM 2522 / FERM P-1141 / JCM 9156 / N-4) TaxID=649639 RepID=E6TZ75_EVAC2|nr:aminoglycoside 6'-N-acetyltransferase [Evansella cellulosilytica]ADU28937.1 GCN5-related N-acetyltransferase [Evansella cellulosilytica DSM 2522]